MFNSGLYLIQAVIIIVFVYIFLNTFKKNKAE